MKTANPQRKKSKRSEPSAIIGSKGGGKGLASSPNPTPVEPLKKTVLGVDLKGELLDVKLDLIVDPQGTPDRMPRPGDDDAIKQLAGSMAECGQLQPAMLERLVDGRFCPVFGRRRIAAARLNGWTTIRASVVTPLPDDVRRTVVAIENVQRQDLTPAEETLAVDELILLQAPAAARQLAKPLLDGCGAWSKRLMTADDAGDISKFGESNQAAARHDLLLDHRVRLIASELVAAMLGKPASWVRDRLYIGRLSEMAKRLVLTGKLPLAHAREISKVADTKRRDELAKAYSAGGSDSISAVEAGQLADLQDEVRKCVFALNVVPWKLDVPFAGKVPCEGCPHNSSTNPGLFECGGDVSLTMIGGRGTYGRAGADSAKVAAAGICTLPACYADKLRETKSAISAAAKRIVDGDKKPAEAKVPAFVSPASLEAKVKDRRKSKKRGSRTSSSAELSPAMKERNERSTAEQNAKHELHDAKRKRVSDFEKALSPWLAKKPGRWGLFKALTESKLWQATQDGNEAKAQKAATQPGLRRLMTLIEQPTIAGLIEIEKTCGTKFGLMDGYNDSRSGIVGVLAEVFGLEIDEPPTLDQFLPMKFRTKPPKETMPAGKSSQTSGSVSKKIALKTRFGKLASGAASERSIESGVKTVPPHPANAPYDDGGDE